MFTKTVEVTPAGGFSCSDNVKDLPLSAKSIRDLYFTNKIDLVDAVNLFTKWRYYPIRNVVKLTHKVSGEVSYRYSILPKRGNRVSVRRMFHHKGIEPLIKICELYGRDLPLVVDGKTNFLKLTLTVDPKTCSMNVWNDSRCSTEVVLFKKRLRSLFGQELQFTRADEVNMTGAAALSVPLLVDISIGNNWSMEDSI